MPANFVEPLALETWIIQVFAGNPDIFGAIALMVIAGLAGFFRMNALGMFFMIGMFVLMFSGFIGDTFLILIAIIAGLLVGNWIGSLVKK